MLDEGRLGFCFIDGLEIQSSGKRLDSYFIDRLAIQLSAKSKFISPYQQDILVLMTSWMLAVRFSSKIKQTRRARQFL